MQASQNYEANLETLRWWDDWKEAPGVSLQIVHAKNIKQICCISKYLIYNVML